MSDLNATSNTYQAPPQHPATATGTTGVTGSGVGGTSAHQVNDGSAGANAGQTLGDKLKGGAGVIHGAGEGIRGNINSFVDNIGEQIAGRGQGDVKPSTRTEQQRPAEVAAHGADEFRAGMEQLKK